ncbi:MAG: T9SS type A sorting domain-containing protein [Flavobacteriales bacterium]|nr:MAG: T9SS type A sorting domain-containing protein [Flavobacteriales bacterium]
MTHHTSLIIASLAISACVLTPLAAQAQCTATDNLTTLYAETNGLDGAMFDIVASSAITIECFDANFDAGTMGVDIWYKMGTHVGFESDSTAWTFVGAVDGITSAGPDNPTIIPIDVDVNIPAGATYAFYISNLNTTDPNVKYTDGTTLGATLASDANLQVLEGSGVFMQFGTTFFSPRQFNGTVHYSVGGVGLVERTANNVAVFPTNTSDVLNIVYASVSGLVDATAVDATGRAVLVQRINGSGTSVLDVSSLSAGAYTLILNGATSSVHRFVKH